MPPWIGEDGMRFGAIVSLGASAALGLGALVVARVYLPAQAGKAVAVHSAAPAGVPVVLAAAPIAYGEKLQPKQLVLARLPADAVPPGAFASIDQVLKQDGGGAPVALVAISTKEPLLAAKLSGPGARATLAALISEGKRAYTIGVTEVAGGGGHVLPGDRVDVVLTRDVSQGSGIEGAQRNKLVSEVVLQNIRVLGMDLNVDPASTKPTVARTATLEVSVEDAERLALAAQAGTLSLALRKIGSAEVQPVRPLATADLNPGGAPAPSGPRRPGRVRAVPAQPKSEVIIMNGDKRAVFSVASERFAPGV
jgi:pilus assembly protein CpaB